MNVAQHAPFARQRKTGIDDKPGAAHGARLLQPGSQRAGDVLRRQGPDGGGDRSRAQIAVGRQQMRGHTGDRGMARQIDGIGDQGCGGIRMGRDRPCQPDVATPPMPLP